LVEFFWCSLGGIVPNLFNSALFVDVLLLRNFVIILFV